MKGKEQEKEIRWMGSSYHDLLAFPEEPRRQAGFQLGKIQAGLDPDDWKAFDASAPERAKSASSEADGIYRVMYVTKFVEALYVLHCFQKKTQKLTRRIETIAEMRYRAIINDRKT